jgi:hypothetical protein
METVLCGPWLRNQKLFFNHFVEALFVLNRCTAHPIYVAATMGDGGSGIAVIFEGSSRVLSGKQGAAACTNFSLSKMSDERKTAASGQGNLVVP